MSNEPSESELLRRAAGGDSHAAERLFALYRPRLKRMVRVRMNRRLAGRLDASDVVQETLLEASEHLDEYLREHAAGELPFFLWLRRLAGQKLIVAHRRNLGAKMRDASREISLHCGGMPSATSASLAAQLLGRLTSPSQAAVKAEMRLKLQEALEGMEEIDREVLALRHFEQLTNAEAARTLEISEAAASKRYVRALERMQQTLKDMRVIEND